MWLTLSSYSDECMAAVLKDQPGSRRELARRFEEVHPQGNKQSPYPGYRSQSPCRSPYGFNNRFPSFQGRQEYFQDSRQQQPYGFQQRQQSPPQQHNQQRQYPQQQQPVVGKDDRTSYQPRCFICNDPGHKAGACPNKGKGYSNHLSPRSRSDAWGRASLEPRRSQTSLKV